MSSDTGSRLKCYIKSNMLVFRHSNQESAPLPCVLFFFHLKHRHFSNLPTSFSSRDHNIILTNAPLYSPICPSTLLSTILLIRSLKSQEPQDPSHSQTHQIQVPQKKTNSFLPRFLLCKASPSQVQCPHHNRRSNALALGLPQMSHALAPRCIAPLPPRRPLLLRWHNRGLHYRQGEEAQSMRK